MGYLETEKYLTRENHYGFAGYDGMSQVRRIHFPRHGSPASLTEVASEMAFIT